eukprot:scaffold50486_cov86-Cyclotella_meneghiniana.AAC.5
MRQARKQQSNVGISSSQEGQATQPAVGSLNSGISNFKDTRVQLELRAKANARSSYVESSIAHQQSDRDINTMDGEAWLPPHLLASSKTNVSPLFFAF